MNMEGIYTDPALCEKLLDDIAKDFYPDSDANFEVRISRVKEMQRTAFKKGFELCLKKIKDPNYKITAADVFDGV